MNPSTLDLHDEILAYPHQDHSAKLAALSPTDASDLRAALTANPQAVALILTRGTPLAAANMVLIARECGATPDLGEIRALASGRSGLDQKPPGVSHRATNAPPAPSAPVAGGPRFPSDALAMKIRGTSADTTLQRAKLASAQLAERMADREWASKALQRGTPEAQEHLSLAATANGASMSDKDIAELASGRSYMGNHA